MNTNTHRIATYTRVSTDGQSVAAQRLELQEYATARGWIIAHEYTDTASGVKSSRSGLDALMAAIRKGKITLLLSVKMDRIGRSFPHMAQLLGELDSAGCALVCSSQPVDTRSESPTGRLMMHVLMSMAEFERSMVRERTRAGVKAAKAAGKVLGRPRTLDAHRADILTLRATGLSMRAIAAKLTIPAGSVFATLRQHKRQAKG
jgi:DNA invertase Pin-like site-specific DNA recombinase